MRIALTGATGFLGRHTVAALLDAGHSVACISRRGFVPALPHRGAPTEDDAWGVKADVLDQDALTEAFSGADVVVHGAGFVSNRARDAQKVFDVHVKGTHNAIAAARAAGVRRFVLVSTSGTVAVGSTDEVRDESSPRPIEVVSRWPYYRTKLFAEEAAFAEAGDLEVVSVNPSLLLGPGDDPDGASTHSVRTFLDDGMPVTPPGGVAFVDVRDAADGIVRAITRGRAGERYLLNGYNGTFFEYFRRIARLADKPEPVVAMPKAAVGLLDWLPGVKREGKMSFGLGAPVSRNELDLTSHFWYCSSAKAEEELGWRARDPGETLSETVRDLLDRAVW